MKITHVILAGLAVVTAVSAAYRPNTLQEAGDRSVIIVPADEARSIDLTGIKKNLISRTQDPAQQLSAEKVLSGYQK